MYASVCGCVFVFPSQTAVHQPSVKVRVQPDEQQEMSHQDKPRQPCTKLLQQITDLHPSAVTPDWGGCGGPKSVVELIALSKIATVAWTDL